MIQDLDDILDDCFRRIRLGEATIDECVVRYPRLADQLRPTLDLAEMLQHAPVPQLSSEDRQMLRTQVIERVLASRRLARPPSPPKATIQRPRLWRWAPALSVLLAVCLLIGYALPAAAQSALPGEVLYPIKRLSESVQVALTPAESVSEIHVQFAQRRIEEFKTLSSRGQVEDDLIAEAAEEYDSALHAIETSPQPGNRAILNTIALTAEEQVQALTLLTAQAPSEKQAALQLAVSRLQASHEQAASILATRFEPMPGAPVAATLTATATLMMTTTSTSTAIPISTEIVATMVISDSQPPHPAFTPPGLANTPKPKNTPPGLANTPRPPNTPPGQVKTPKPTTEPPGQENPKPTKKPKK
jgi:hypothetical protein